MRATYSRVDNPDPEITEALANVLRNEDNQGVRIKAADTLQSVQAVAEEMFDTAKDQVTSTLQAGQDAIRPARVTRDRP